MELPKCLPAPTDLFEFAFRYLVREQYWRGLTINLLHILLAAGLIARIFHPSAASLDSDLSKTS